MMRTRLREYPARSNTESQPVGEAETKHEHSLLVAMYRLGSWLQAVAGVRTQTTGILDWTCAERSDP